MEKTLDRLETYILYAVVFLVPITVLPISPNPFVVGKLSVLVFGLSLALLVRAVKVIVSGKLELRVGNFDLPVALIAIAYLVSTMLRTPNKMEALLLPGTATLIIGAAILYFLLNQLKTKDKEILHTVILASGSTYALITIVAAAGIFAKIPQLPLFMRATVFSPEGGYLPSAIFLASLVPLGIGLWLKRTNGSGSLLTKPTALKIAGMKLKSKMVYGAMLIVLAIGLGYSVYNIIPGRPNSPRFPGFGTSWFIAVDTLKTSPFFGVGPGNYITAFNQFRPLTFNQTDLWAIKFSTANDFYLTALTETGLLGAAGFILLILAAYRLIKKDMVEKKLVGWGLAGSSSLFSLALIIILLALFPATVTTTLLLFILLAVNAKTSKTSLNLTSQVSGESAKGIASRLPAIIVALPIIITVGFVGFRAAGIVNAEYKFRQGLSALARNEGILAYDVMREAINANPQVDRYHASYSQVNLALANAIASNPDITDSDRTNIAQLVQQAIRESKATVALNPMRSGNWEILARTYQTIMPLATGADVFAAQTYGQAVALDPINPNLRVALGGIHYAIGNYDTAVRVFELAVLTKQDLANSHYNLAFALEKNGVLDRAISEMTLVLSLVDRDSQDYEFAKTALENMQERRETEVQATENLIPPQQAQEPVLEPPLDLPEESEPPSGPEAEATPTPTPTPEPETEGDEGGEETEGEPTVTPEVTPAP